MTVWPVSDLPPEERIRRLKGGIVHDTSIVIAALQEIAELRPSSHIMVATVKLMFVQALEMSEREL